MEEIINSTITTNWKDILLNFDFTKINEQFFKEVETYEPEFKMYPPRILIFSCFNYFNFENTNVVILGMDPYINENEATGLAFSVPDEVKIPPSLINIFKEIESDIGIKHINGNLTYLAKQGILLLNSALTVRQGKSNSHKNIWINYTNYLIKYISDNLSNIVFILWGNDAKSKKSFIDTTKHHILESVHPSPLSANKGFFGNKHFSKTNNILQKYNKNIINW